MATTRAVDVATATATVAEVVPPTLSTAPWCIAMVPMARRATGHMVVMVAEDVAVVGMKTAPLLSSKCMVTSLLLRLSISHADVVVVVAAVEEDEVVPTVDEGMVEEMELLATLPSLRGIGTEAISRVTILDVVYVFADLIWDLMMRNMMGDCGRV